MKDLVGVFGLVLALAVGAATVGIAAQPEPKPPVATPAATDGFEPVTDLPPAEQLPAAPLVLSAYAFIWVAVLLYVWLLWRKLAAVQKDLDALKHTLQR
jgi:CcmD family protein